MEASVTPAEKSDAIRRLLAVEKSVRALADASGEVADAAAQSGATGLAFSLHMVRESILVYGKEAAKWTRKLLGDLDS
jgi:hypothetical protein